MGILSRISTLFKAKVNRALDSAENPHETLEYSYEKQLELLRNVKRGIVEVVTSKRRIELQAQEARTSLNRLDEQAAQAVRAGRDDLARMALQRKQLAGQQLQGLEDQLRGLEQEQEKLTLAEQRLSAKVEAFKTRKEVIKAQYTAAEAQVRIGDAINGLSEEMADVGLAVERAEEKTQRLRARASAIDELTSSGVLTDLTIGPSDNIGRELAKISADQSVEDELARLKGQTPGSGPRQLSSGG
jgi:phage shock protein A